MIDLSLNVCSGGTPSRATQEKILAQPPCSAVNVPSIASWIVSLVLMNSPPYSTNSWNRATSSRSFVPKWRWINP